MKRSTLLRLAILLALAGFAVAVLLFLPIRDYLSAFFQWVKDVDPWGPVVLAALYVPATVFLIPGSLLTLGAGFAFGVVKGTAAVSIGSTLGAAAAFLVGRFLARDWVESRVAAHPKFRAIDRAVGEQGFKIVLLTRLSPIFPFTLLNYAYGLTRVRFRDYLLASWLGMLPGTVMYVYVGSLTKDFADLLTGTRDRTAGQQVLFYGGLMLTVVLAVYITRVAKKALDRAIAEPQEAARQESKA